MYPGVFLFSENFETINSIKEYECDNVKYIFSIQNAINNLIIDSYLKGNGFNTLSRSLKEVLRDEG